MSAARHTCAELVEAIHENGSPASSRLLASKDAGVPSFLRALRVSA